MLDALRLEGRLFFARDPSREEAPDPSLDERCAAETVFALYKNAMFRAAFGILRDEEEAEDAVMDAVEKICAAPEEFEGLPERNRKLLVLRTAENAALDRLRKRKRRAAHEIPHPADEEGNGAGPPGEGEVSAEDAYFEAAGGFGDLESAVARLTEKERTLVSMKYGEGYTNKEIARSLGMTETAVSTGLERARTRLRKELTKRKKEDPV